MNRSRSARSPRGWEPRTRRRRSAARRSRSRVRRCSTAISSPRSRCATCTGRRSATPPRWPCRRRSRLRSATGRAGGRALLCAVAAGLETTVRVGLGTNYPAFRARGWHSPGVIGPFGGAAAAGKLLGLDAERQRNAFGLAGSQSAGTFAQWGTPTIKFHQARGALSGLLAALLAEQGFLSSNEVLAHKDGGLFNAYSDGGNPEAVTDELGTRWELESIALRLWPAGSSIQTVISSLLALIDAHGLRPDRIASVRVGLSKTVDDMHRTLSWTDKFTALLSTPYVASIVLHDRSNI